MPTYRKQRKEPPPGVSLDEVEPGSYGPEGEEGLMGMEAGLMGMEEGPPGSESTEAWLNKQEARHRGGGGGIEDELDMLGTEGMGEGGMGAGGIEQMLASLGGEGGLGGGGLGGEPDASTELTPPTDPIEQVAAMDDLIQGLEKTGGPNAASTGDVAVPWVPTENAEELMPPATAVKLRGLPRMEDYI